MSKADQMLAILWLLKMPAGEAGLLQRLELAVDEEKLYGQVPCVLLSYGGSLHVAEPQELRACLADLSLALYKRYRDNK
ncbi:hypothetical protein [Paenibacillus arenilitoris]|uniref:Uncharacterized protein n=1 Tax=Paenibacillus arenilitoris TaxID=2772299 RepID=A0A927CSL8_9BACL|nr:hypothetical protein [Paenibacillus arenilitoris]MBD2871136.1 hypothetical protein [Paenibacillus arenilitoris]